MLKERLKKISEAIKVPQWLRRWQEKIPSLWSYRRKILAMSVAVGFFAAFMPIPFQMPVAGIVAVLLEVNLPIAMAAVWISNPITMVPMFLIAYKVGAWLTQSPDLPELVFSWQGMLELLPQIWMPFLTGCVICGLLAAVVGYFLVMLIWYLATLMRAMKRKRASKMG